MKPAFRRKVGTRHYKRNLIIVTEGEATEQSYLRIVSRLYMLGERFNFIFAHKDSGISNMLTAMAVASAATEDFKPERRDAKWIVLDRDAESHLTKQLADLQAWEEAEECCHVAMTTPRFEYRLLLHKPDCSGRLGAGWLKTGCGGPVESGRGLGARLACGCAAG